MSLPQNRLSHGPRAMHTFCGAAGIMGLGPDALSNRYRKPSRDPTWINIVPVFTAPLP